jgi:hypothetical protein
METKIINPILRFKNSKLKYKFINLKRKNVETPVKNEIPRIWVSNLWADRSNEGTGKHIALAQQI